MTGFPNHVRQLIRQRADEKCERCGNRFGTQAHHRRPRGAGGSSRGDTNTASNSGWLCTECHAWVESHRTEARNEGWLVTQQQSPADIPVKYRGDWVFLDDDGGLQPHTGGHMKSPVLQGFWGKLAGAKSPGDCVNSPGVWPTGLEWT